MSTGIENTPCKAQDNELEQMYGEQYRIYVLPYIDLGKETFRIADLYTQSIVRALFILNGGAIAIIPALSTFKTESTKLDLLVLSLGMFAIGLCLAILFTLACRHNLYIVSDLFELGAERERQQIAKRFCIDHTNRPPIQRYLKTGSLDVLERKLGFSYSITYTLSYVFGASSFIAFVGGILLASKAMLGRWVFPTEIVRLLIN